MTKILHYTNIAGEDGPGYLHEQIRQALEDSNLEYKYKYFPIQNINEFDREAAKEIERCDLYIGEVGYSYFQLKKAKKLGAKTLLTRFSTHHLHQQRVLQDIYALYGMKVFPNGLYNALKEYSLADYFLVLSEFCKYTYVLYGVPSAKIFVVPPGVDVDTFRPAPSSSATDTHGKFKVLFVGTNPIRKGLSVLLKTWQELDIDGELIVRSAVQIPGIKNVICVPQWLKFLSEDLVKLYQGSTVVVLPSLEEGFPLTTLESMSCGKPVIITNVCGTADVVSNYKEGILISPANIKELKEAIQYCYDNPEEVQRMGLAARKLAEQYPWKRFRNSVVKVVRDILQI